MFKIDTCLKDEIITQNDTNKFLFKEPEKWSKKDVKHWLKWCTHEYSLNINDIPFDKFEMNGKAICMFTEEMFKQRVPNNGDILYKALKTIIPYNYNSTNLKNESNKTQYFLQIQDQASSDSENISLTHDEDDDQLIIDENLSTSTNDDTQRTKHTHNDTPKCVKVTQKRGANLENVIGHLKTRKIMEQQYINPLLSPSSTSSSTTSLPPNKRWIAKNNSLTDSLTLATPTSLSSSTSSLRLVDNQHDSSPTSSLVDEDLDDISPTASLKLKKTSKKTSKLSLKQSTNAEDPTRQIKFYDDYIDFRGDILRRPPGAKNCRILWEYLYTLLQDTNYAAIIRWEDEEQMVFRIIQAEKLAALWGLQKNRLGMTYEKLSRGMRYYYPNNIIAREPGRRLLYRFMRHPDDIKKTVKKNGTYMLKKAPGTSSPLAPSTPSKNEASKNEDFNDMYDDDSGLSEATTPKLATTHSTNNNLNTQQKASFSTLTSPPPPPPPEKVSSQSFYNQNNFYQYLTAAAAAATAIKSQYLNSKMSITQTKDEESAANFLLQLRNIQQTQTNSTIDTTKHASAELPLDLCKKHFLKKLNDVKIQRLNNENSIAKE